MTTYTINLSNGDLLTTLLPQTEDVTHSPITLFGQGTVNYGQLFNDNLVHMVEHFCSAVAPSHPLTGTLWYDSAYSIFRVWNGTAWIELRPETSPSNAGITQATVGSTTIVGLLSHGKLVATISDSAINQLSLPSQISFRDVNYAFSSRFPNGIGAGISISSDVELSQSDNTDTLVTSKWVKSQGYVSSLSGATITAALGYTPLNPANNLSDVANASLARSHLGLDSMALQNPNSVSIAGGAINGTTIGAITPSSGVFTTLNLTASQTAKFVLAAPTLAPGAPTWRQLTSSDISGVVTVGNALIPSNNLSDVASASTSRTNLGLGTISVQDSSAVTITGGTINGTAIGNVTASTGAFTTISLSGSQSQHFVLAAPSGSAGAPTFRQLVAADISGSVLVASNNLSDVASASTSRTNLGLGTISTQAANNITISGGTIDGVVIGGGTPAAGSFTTISLSSSQSQHFALAAPSGSAGAPSFRQLVSGDISGLGTIATQNANNVSISGGLMDGVAIGSTTPSTGTFTNVDNTGVYKVLTTQVITTRQTGWTAATGTPTRATFATSSVTLSELAEHVKALIDDLMTHGLIGN